ncbi:AmmeMemoRadiSam system protein A [Candidatus Parcubacteria bacterium]|nr:MAG: AmmeMemoRadiSam system protein A [Candidatus Parcubacteria bacterium]
MNLETKQYLLKLARNTIEHYLDTESQLEVDESDLKDDILKEKQGVFVTLEKHGQLRGCMGYIDPVEAVYTAVIENALKASFGDPRFQPLARQELAEIKIEISVLSKSEKVSFDSPEQLLEKLEPMKHGVVIKKGPRSATYLPQVWEELSQKEEFLSSLCKKAGLSPLEWKDGHVDVFVYTVEVFSENSV